jgi:hypothetical protein
MDRASVANGTGAAQEPSISRKLATFASLVLVCLFGFVAYYERAYARLSHGLDRDLTAAHEYRWERPVLRGPMGDGNATDDIYAALNDWKPLGSALRRSLAERVYYGEALEPAELKAVQERSPQLRALRDSTQQRWAHTDLSIERGAAMRVPDYPSMIDAALGLLAEAQTSAPDACLQEAVDVIRIGQDIVPSAPLEAPDVSARVNAFAAKVLARCARGADLTSLRRTGHELRVLATHPAPIGSCIELEELTSAIELRKRAALTNKQTPWHVAKTLIERPQLMAAWALYDNPARFRQLSPDHYPDAMEEWKREEDYRTRTSAGDVAAAAGQVLLRMQADMRAQAIVRMLCVGFNALAERAYRGSMPTAPAALRESGLADPYRGQPFRYQVASNGVELSLWSVGADFRDDNGADDWTEAGPRDIAVHFPLK